ncbi:PotD/PotF family extracellular solute-binding protein [Kineosporia sp. R_H_3]|uniref:ABC transporter substrate-binding protein n=1 Tax=Kineosporia sp. R_H_3 TaxID=1961848 RepID=UPI000B4ADFC6|nr:spermidine/putrescine ABC transporter substrate-binding protein [Kineosporia sp. R_H_3]
MSQPHRRPPLSPEAAQIVRAMQAGRLSRRSMLTGAGALGMGAFLAACSTSAPGATGSATGGAGTGTAPAGKPSPAVDKSDAEKVVNWANWTLYLDFDDKSKTYPTLEAFQEKTGIKATYSEDIEDNDSYYGKVQAQLKAGQDIGKDIVVFTDYMAARVVRQGLVQPLVESVMPNKNNILDNLANVSYDQGRKQSLTWQSGYAGLAWNKAKVPGGLKNVSDLWKPELKGRVEVLSEWRDTLGLIMMEQGKRIDAKFADADFENALAVLEKQLNDGQIRQVKGNSYKEDLISEDALAVIGWSGDIFQLVAENGDKWGFALPEAGGTLWSDNMVIPVGSPHAKNASTLMNYYYDPKIAAEVAAYVNYICPVKGAQAEMEKIDAELAKSPLIFPTESDLSNVQVFFSLDPETETRYTEQFQKVLGN